MNLRMTMSAEDFLYVWIDASIMGEPREQAEAGKLAAKLLSDAAVAGFTSADLGLDQETAETYIRDAIVHLTEPGTPAIEGPFSSTRLPYLPPWR
jgi:hypothetical protein